MIILNKKIRFTALLVGILLMGMSLTGCAPGNASQKEGTAAETEANEAVTGDETDKENNAETGDSFKFTDSAGREVELPTEITRIAPAGYNAQIVLYSIAPDKLVGWANKPEGVTAEYFDEAHVKLPAFGSYFSNTFNLEELLAAKPDVIIDIGEAKDSIKEDMDEIQETTNIPTVFIEASLESTPEAFQMLGELLQEEEQGNALTTYTQETLDEAKRISNSIPEKERVTLFYGMYETGLNTNAKGSFHSEVIDYVGVENVAVMDDIASKGGGSEVSMEQLLLWNPDMILFSTDSVYEPVTNGDELWKDLEAVQHGFVYETPDQPYNWLSFPPSVNRFLGIKWLGNLAYPDWYDYDIVEETKTYFHLFYHYDLSDEEAEQLISRSTLKAREN